ncbi:MAG TPA: M3 family metallopeptidase [Gammaproteobacteria bacterium]
MSNPLLLADGLPDFAAIRPEHVEPAIDNILAENRGAIAKLLEQSQPFTWSNLVEPLEALEDRLSRAWSPVSHLNSVANTPELRAAYNACLPKLSDYGTELGHNRALFDAYREVRSASDSLDAAQRKILDDEIRDFHLAGVDLPDDRKSRFKEIQQELSQLTTKFEENLIDAAAAWHLKIDVEHRLRGVPADAIERARKLAEEHDAQGWWFALDHPGYQAIVVHADDRELRREMYTAWSTRASDQGPAASKFDNTEIMRRILSLRAEESRLLGFDNFAEVSLATKMAESPASVLEFLHGLVARVRPAAQVEFDELREFASRELDLADLAAWDVAWASEKLRKARYDISQEELRPYFPLPKVLDGLFAIIEKLYGLRVRETGVASSWHPSVRFFEIRNADDTLRGSLYMDLYARPHKRGGAWMDEALNRFRRGDELQKPVAHLCCNFGAPSGDKPALLSHDDVQTLFHEFGHCLHHLATCVDYPAAAGINGVEWDAVELPSQFHENFTWDREALDFISGHVDTGEVLPDALHEKLLATRNFHAGLFLVRQLEFALFDMKLHAAATMDFESVLQAVRSEVTVVPVPAFNRFAHGFSHIFAGGYSAGYYSYLWAEVMSADAYAAFEEAGLFDRATGERFLHAILEKGGSANAGDLFRDFRGRPPVDDAFLRLHGIEAAAQN